MRSFTQTELDLVKILSDGLRHTKEDLGDAAHVSAAGVEKHIKRLRALGIPILSTPKQGYYLSIPLTLLNESSIREQLAARNVREPVNFHLFASIDSTNRFLKAYPPSTTLEVCCSERQTEGRGRFGRHWFSPFGENIYCSSRWHFPPSLTHLSGLSLVVSLAVWSTLEQFGLADDIQIKWPNDLLWNGRKLSGSLLEMIPESNTKATIVIGIGLNVNVNSIQHTSVDRPWCSLYDITGQYFDRNHLLAELIKQLYTALRRFSDEGFQTFLDQWRQVDYLEGEVITVSQPNGEIRGIAKGVNKFGQLVVLDKRGMSHTISCGDATLHTPSILS